MARNPGLLTANDVADELNVDPETVRRWARDGHLRAITLPSGGKRFRPEDVEKILHGDTSTDAA